MVGEASVAETVGSDVTRPRLHIARSLGVSSRSRIQTNPYGSLLENWKMTAEIDNTEVVRQQRQKGRSASDEVALKVAVLLLSVIKVG
jgi:hypothetical protein